MPVRVTAEAPGQTAEGYDAMLGHLSATGTWSSVAVPR